MTKLTINAKGQVRLKQELLKHLGVAPGEKIEAEKLPMAESFLEPPFMEVGLPISLAAYRKGEGSKLTIDEMNEAQPFCWSDQP
jgi:hypothetical protein